MKKHLVLLITILLVLLIGLPGYASPWVTRSGDANIAKGQTIEGDLLFAGNRLVINGTVKGDLVVIANEVVINGQIDGSLLGVVWTLEFNGSVGRDFRVLAGAVQFDGTVQRSASVGAGLFYTDAKSHIEGGLLGSFADLSLAGSIDGPADVSSYYSAIISGEINGDLKVHGLGIKWLAPLKVQGKVTDFTSVKAPAKQKGVTFAGGYKNGVESATAQLSVIKFWTMVSFVWFLGTLLLSLIFYRLFPRIAWEITEPSPVNFRRSLLTGLLGFIIIPFVILLSISFMIAFPLTTVALPIVVIFSIIYLVLLMFYGVPVYLWFGRIIFKSKLRPNFLIILGGLIFLVINLVPFVNLFFVLIGFGLILRGMRPQINHKEDKHGI